MQCAAKSEGCMTRTREALLQLRGWSTPLPMASKWRPRGRRRRRRRRGRRHRPGAGAPHPVTHHINTLLPHFGGAAGVDDGRLVILEESNYTWPDGSVESVPAPLFFSASPPPPGGARPGDPRGAHAARRAAAHRRHGRRQRAGGGRRRRHRRRRRRRAGGASGVWGGPPPTHAAPRRCTMAPTAPPFSLCLRVVGSVGAPVV